jgi:4-amino-4-deoxy-L-arabinose transferase-like glycosyltransferase
MAREMPSYTPREPSRAQATRAVLDSLRSAPLAARLAGLLALVVFFGAALPFLGSFPIVGQDEPWIAAPAAKLATQGVYGDDLFAGYYGMERRTYNFPPLFPMAEALAFRLLGVGVWQARLVAVLFGAATLALSYALGWRLHGEVAGAIAAWLLVGLRLAAERDASGVPLLDLARVARYDIAVPPLVLAALLCFVWAETKDQGPKTKEARCLVLGLWALVCQHWHYLITGALVGLAALAHVYGAFVLAPIGALLLWRHGARLIRRPAPYLIAAGCGLALLPWALYVLQDLPSYRGQMLPERARFRLADPIFYLASLWSEPARYRRLFFDGAELSLWPRVGIWVAAIGLPLSSALLFCRAVGPMTNDERPTVAHSWSLVVGPPRLLSQPANRHASALPDRLLLLTLPLLALLLALLVNLKFYNYLLLLLPFMALNLAWLAVWLWRRAARWGRWSRAARLALGALLALLLAEGAAGIAHGLRRGAATSDYQAYTRRVAAAIPPGSRVLALHQFWFGVYQQGYQYRSAALPSYFADPNFYPIGPELADLALERIAPEYVLVDRYLAPELRLEDAPGTALDEPWRSFRRYLERRCAQAVARIDDPDYGALTIIRVCP